MKTRADGVRRFVAWAGAEGSTVPMAVIRIGLALLLWARWGEAMVLVHADSAAMVALSLTFFAGTTLMLVGLWTRAATSVTAAAVLVMYFGIGAAGGRTEWIHHHHFLLAAATVLCALTPCGRSLSIDRLRRPEVEQRGPLVGLRLMTAQLSAVYLWSAIDKCEWGFLSGQRLEQILGFYYMGSDLPLGTGLRAGCMAAALAIVGLELGLAIGVWLPRTHRVLLPLGVVFHAALYVLLPVATFSATMVLLYLAVIDARAVERGVRRLVDGREDAGI